MVKIGKNELCPCASGKKYKDCCQNNVQIIPNMGLEAYPEKFVIGKLLKSQHFSDFYTHERDKISDTIYWVEEPNPQKGRRGTTATFRQGGKFSHIIFLNHIPASIVTQFTVAHEIGHVLIDQQGFLGIRPVSIDSNLTGNIQSLCAAVNSIFHDVQINTMLNNYGFDWASHLRKDLDTSLLGLKHWNNSDNAYNRLLLISHYLKLVLSCDELGKGGLHDHGFFKLYSDKFPYIVADGEDLVRIINDTGYETYTKQLDIIDKILIKCDLRQQFEIYNQDAMADY